jgi:hypothetical protein
MNVTPHDFVEFENDARVTGKQQLAGQLRLYGVSLLRFWSFLGRHAKTTGVIVIRNGWGYD